MSKQAELYDGTVLDFPDDTPDDVIGKTAARETARIKQEKTPAVPDETEAKRLANRAAMVEKSAVQADQTTQGDGSTFYPVDRAREPLPPEVGGVHKVTDPGRGLMHPPTIGEGRRPGESVLEMGQGRPWLNVPDPNAQRDYEADEVSPLERSRRASLEAQDRQIGVAHETPLAIQAGIGLSKALKGNILGPVVQGVAGGVAELGKVVPGAVSAVADAVGARDVADFAQGATRVASDFQSSSQPLGEGVDKDVANVFSSITSSLPFMLTGTAAEKIAFKLMFAQTTLADYGERRAQGIQPLPAAITSVVTGAAEVLGEKFGFKEQTAAVKNLMSRMAQHGSGADDMAKNAAKLLIKEVPGEELTTAIEFLNEKYNLGGLTPEATLAEYFKQATDTLVTTMGQAAVVGGSPALLNARKKGYQKAERAINQSAGLIPAGPYREAAEKGFVTDPPLITDPALVQRAKTNTIFENAAGQHGVSSEAVKRAKEAAASMPLDQVGPFFSDMLQALQRKGGVATPIAPHIDAALTAGPATPMTEAETAKAEGEPVKAETKAPENEPADVPRETTGKLVRTADGFKVEPTPVDVAAHTAATSPQNDLVEPTTAQALAGNYSKGHAKIGGLDISIENPEGSTRRDKNNEPPQWETTMAHHYGYIRGTVGQDGEHIDTFIQPGTPEDFSGNVFVVDQTHADGTPDEHKVMLGFDTIQDAKKAYLSNYQKGWKGMGAITPTTMDGFKVWLKNGDTTKPFARNEPAQSDLQPAADVAAQPAAQRSDQPGRSGGNVGLAPAAPARPNAAAPASSVRPAAPVRNGSDSAAPVSEHRTIGRAGTTPNTATPIELRANKDGTVTPWHDGYELLDHESADPIKIKAAATDREALDAIKAAGAFGRRTKVFADKATPAEAETPAGTPEAFPAAENVPASKTDGRSASASKTAKTRMSFKPETDSVLQALAKMGGIKREQVASEFGLRPEELKHTVNAGNLKGYPFRATGGMGIDIAITALREAGFFPGVSDEDVRGKLEEAIHGELGGTTTLSVEGQMHAAAQAIDEHEIKERDGLLDEAALSERDMAALSDDDIQLDPKSNNTTEAFMRAMGFSDKEIADETAKQARDEKASAAEAGQVASQEESAPAGAGSAEASASAKPTSPLTDHQAFVGNYAAFEGATVEQSVQVAGTDKVATLKLDGAKALRTLDERETALKGLIECIRKRA